MRKIITTCVFIALLLIQGTESGQAKQRYQVAESVHVSTEARGEMSLPENRIEVCPVPNVEAEDQELAETFVNECFSGSKNIDTQLYVNASKLLNVETNFGVPDAMRGITLAAACIESGFDPHAEGDHRFSKDGKTPMAIGILQMWPWFEKSYHVDRRDLVSASSTWLKHVKRQTASVKKNCGASTDAEIWRLAWVHGVRAPKKGGRCNENVSHWRFFKRVKNKIENRNV